MIFLVLSVRAGRARAVSLYLRRSAKTHAMNQTGINYRIASLCLYLWLYVWQNVLQLSKLDDFLHVTWYTKVTAWPIFRCNKCSEFVSGGGYGSCGTSQEHLTYGYCSYGHSLGCCVVCIYGDTFCGIRNVNLVLENIKILICYFYLQKLDKKNQDNISRKKIIWF